MINFVNNLLITCFPNQDHKWVGVYQHHPQVHPTSGWMCTITWLRYRTNLLTNSSDWKLLRIYCFTVILEISLTTGVPGMSLNIISKFGNKPGNTPLLMVTFTVASLNCPLTFYWFSVFCFNCYNFAPDCPQKTGPR